MEMNKETVKFLKAVKVDADSNNIELVVSLNYDDSEFLQDGYSSLSTTNLDSKIIEDCKAKLPKDYVLMMLRMLDPTGLRSPMKDECGFGQRCITYCVEHTYPGRPQMRSSADEVKLTHRGVCITDDMSLSTDLMFPNNDVYAYTIIFIIESLIHYVRKK